MSTGTALPSFVCFAQGQYNGPSPQSSLKRNFSLLSSVVGQGDYCYPSPPMSGPPSPAQSSAELAGRTVSGTTPLIPAVTTSASSFISTLQPPPALTQRSLPESGPESIPEPPTSAEASRLPPPPFPPPSSGLTGPQCPPLGTHQSAQALSGRESTTTLGATVAETSSTRTGRKSKAHVASACVNCKRAHLSCDIQRPCARCVASGKQVHLREKPDYRLLRY